MEIRDFPIQSVLTGQEINDDADEELCDRESRDYGDAVTRPRMVARRKQGQIQQISEGTRLRCHTSTTQSGQEVRDFGHSEAPSPVFFV